LIPIFLFNRAFVGYRVDRLSQGSQRSQGTATDFLCVPCDPCERLLLSLLVECTVNRRKRYETFRRDFDRSPRRRDA